MDLQLIPVPNQDFCKRQVDGETVLLAESGNQYISLNAVGSFIWEQIDGNHSLNDILDILCHEYEVDRERALADIETFVTQLADEGLLTLESADS